MKKKWVILFLIIAIGISFFLYDYLRYTSVDMTYRCRVKSDCYAHTGYCKCFSYNALIEPPSPDIECKENFECECINYRCTKVPSL
jgi:hypothetical protein